MQKIIRSADLKSVTGYSVRRIYELIAENKFPKPIVLGPHSVGWLEDAITKWQEDLAAGEEWQPGDRQPKRAASSAA